MRSKKYFTIYHDNGYDSNVYETAYFVDYSLLNIAHLTNKSDSYRKMYVLEHFCKFYLKKNKKIILTKRLIHL